jgi:transposase
MPKSPLPYPPEFRRQMVELVRAGRTPGELACEFEPSAQAIRTRVRQAERDEGHCAEGLTSVEREELVRLRREVRRLREERAILAKAAAWFARETGSIPPNRTGTLNNRANLELLRLKSLFEPIDARHIPGEATVRAHLSQQHRLTHQTHATQLDLVRPI